MEDKYVLDKVLSGNSEAGIKCVVYLFHSYNSFLCVLVCGNSKHVISIPLSDAVFNLCIFIHVSIISFYPANWWIRWRRLRRSELVCAYSRQRRKFCQSVSWYFGHQLSSRCPGWARTDELASRYVFRPSRATAFSFCLTFMWIKVNNFCIYFLAWRMDFFFFSLHTCIFSKICPLLDITRVSIGHIKIVYEKCLEAKRGILRTSRGQCSLVTLKPSAAQMPINKALHWILL